jgi:hypothetical protein
MAMTADAAPTWPQASIVSKSDVVILQGRPACSATLGLHAGHCRQRALNPCAWNPSSTFSSGLMAR